MDPKKEAAELLNNLVPIFREAKVGVYDITRGEMAVLAHLCLGEAPANPTRLSELTGLTTARIANTLNSLEKKNYIRRSHDKEDRRRVTVDVTDKGRSFAKNRYEETLGYLCEMIAYIGEDDTAALIRISKKVSGMVQSQQKQE